MTLFRRLWHLVNRRRLERELVQEMRDHRESMHDPSRFGDTHRLLERSRDEWGWNWLDDALQDFTVGVRTLLRSPSFAITATLILTFGIGLNVTLYPDDPGDAAAAARDQVRRILGALSSRGAATAAAPRAVSALRSS